MNLKYWAWDAELGEKHFFTNRSAAIHSYRSNEFPDTYGVEHNLKYVPISPGYTPRTFHFEDGGMFTTSIESLFESAEAVLLKGL